MLFKICSGPLKPIKFVGAVLTLKKYVKLLKSIVFDWSRISAVLLI